MKILIIQLARLSDVFLTWPTVRALRRKYPEAQIDLLVRRLYSPACEGLSEIDNVRLLDAPYVLEPLFRAEVEVGISLERMAGWVEGLEHQSYDEVINLSFSPLSSYLARRLQVGGARIRGYSRHADGTFNPNDDVGAYFYAQVGPEGANRVHLSKLFAGLADVELCADDWCYTPPTSAEQKPLQDSLTKPFAGGKSGPLLVHIGATQKEKTLNPTKWANIIVRLLRDERGPIVLLGHHQEGPMADEIMTITSHPEVVNLVGKTTLRDLFALLQKARIHVGCDGAPIHMASLVGVPTLNLTFAGMNFWETGPRAEGSRMIWARSPEEVASDRVAQEIGAMLDASPPTPPILLVSSAIEGYEAVGFAQEPVAWELIKSLYMKDPLPRIEDSITWQGIENLHEMNLVCIEQLQILKADRRHATAFAILDEGDRIFNLVHQMVPDLRPLIQWYRTEKIRLGPGTFDDILCKTEEIHQQLAIVTEGFLHFADLQQQEVGRGRISLE